MTDPLSARAAARLADAVQAHRVEILDLSHRIHADPEPGFEEHRASAFVAETLARHGYAVERPAGSISTAIRARLTGTRPGPTVAILAEYDALRGLGHGCGHNLISAAGVGAAIALAAARDDLPGTVVFLGTPAEEDLAGKQPMLDDGLFEGVDAAMMIHASNGTQVRAGAARVDRRGDHVHGRAGTRVDRPVARPERAGRADPAVHVDRPVAPAAAHRRARPRDHHGRRRSGEHHPRARGRPCPAPLARQTRTTLRCGTRLRGHGPSAAGNRRRTPTASCAGSRTPRRCATTRRSVHDSASTSQPPGVADGPLSPRLGSSDIGNVSFAVPTIHPMLAITDDAVPLHSEAFRELAATPRADEVAPARRDLPRADGVGCSGRPRACRARVAGIPSLTGPAARGRGRPPPSAADILERHFAEIQALYARAAGGEVRDDGDVQLSASGLPARVVNAANVAQFTNGTAAARIEDVKAFFAAAAAPVPLVRRADVGALGSRSDRSRPRASASSAIRPGWPSTSPRCATSRPQRRRASRSARSSTRPISRRGGRSARDSFPFEPVIAAAWRAVHEPLGFGDASPLHNYPRPARTADPWRSRRSSTAARRPGSGTSGTHGRRARSRHRPGDDAHGAS